MGNLEGAVGGYFKAGSNGLTSPNWLIVLVDFLGIEYDDPVIERGSGHEL